jgi:flagellar hook-associated protein 3 FlgL
MSNSLNRIGTANMYDNALRHLSERHANLSGLQEQLTSGKRVNKPSDDPVAAAQAERAMTRIMRNDTDKRALEMQRNTMTLAESALGDAVSAMQSFRELVSAGSGAYRPSTTPLPRWRACGSRSWAMPARTLTACSRHWAAPKPFAGTRVQLAGAGQLASGMIGHKGADGQAAWMATEQRRLRVDLTPATPDSLEPQTLRR